MVRDRIDPVSPALALALALAPAAAQERAVDAASLAAVRLAKPGVHGGFHAFDVDPKGRMIAGGIGTVDLGSASGGGEILLWSPRTGKVVREIGRHDATPTWVRFRPDGRSVVTFSSDDAALRVWKTSGGKPRVELTLGGPAKDDRPPQLGPDGRLVIHAVQLPQIKRNPRSAITGDLEAWDLGTGKLRWKRADSQAQAFAISPDGGSVAAWIDEVDWSGKSPGGDHVRSVLVLLDAANGKVIWEAPTARLDLLHLLFLPDGSQLLGVSYRELHRFSTEDGAELGEPGSLDADNYCRRVALTPDGNTLLVWRSTAESIDLYDVAECTRRCRIDFRGVDRVMEPWFAPHAQALVGKLGFDPAFVSLKKALKD